MLGALPHAAGKMEGLDIKMDIYEAKTKLEAVKKDIEENIDHDDARETTDRYLSDCIIDLQYEIDQLEEAESENEKSDFDEHNVWYSGGGGVL